MEEKHDRLSSFPIQEAQKVEDCPYPHLPKGYEHPKINPKDNITIQIQQQFITVT